MGLKCGAMWKKFATTFVSLSHSCPDTFHILSHANVKETLFHDYLCESIRSDICLEVDATSLQKVLKDGDSMQVQKLKLAKRGSQAYLCFEGRTLTALQGALLKHDIPVRVLAPSEMQRLVEPQMTGFDVE